MTPKERMGAFLTGETLDRLPVIPLILNHATRIAGMTVQEYAQDGPTMGEAHVAAYRFYGQDMITIFTNTAVLAEAMGTELYHPEDDAARVDVPIVESHDDVDKVLDADPREDNAMRVYLEAVEHCANEVGDEVFVSCCFAAPFTTAASLRGTDMLARDLHRDPGLAEVLLEKSLAVGLRFIDACAAAGGVPAIVDPVATGSVLSEEHFRTFALPYLARQVEAIQEKGLPALVHVCGKTHRLLEALAETGADVLSLDIVDMAEAKERIGDRVTLFGNVQPSETLLEGTPEDVEAEVIACLRKAGDSPRGFIIASGCEVPLHSPRENVLAMMEAAETWGKLP
ncbi:MAG: uroporphyrinogen decarboxylase family protein, partial [Armatimonadota bacterium]